MRIAWEDDLAFLFFLIGADEDALKGLAELEIEDGVDDGIDEWVDVAQPGGEMEGHASRLAIAFKFGADGVHDVAREERDPANEEDAYNPLADKSCKTQLIPTPCFTLQIALLIQVLVYK